MPLFLNMHHLGMAGRLVGSRLIILVSLLLRNELLTIEGDRDVRKRMLVSVLVVLLLRAVLLVTTVCIVAIVVAILVSCRTASLSFVTLEWRIPHESLLLALASTITNYTATNPRLFLAVGTFLRLL